MLISRVVFCYYNTYPVKLYFFACFINQNKCCEMCLAWIMRRLNPLKLHSSGRSMAGLVVYMFCFSKPLIILHVCVTERRLVWNEDTDLSFTNWESRNVAFSVLSANSCFWIQSNSGRWKPGSCRNLTHGVICKKPRSTYMKNTSQTVYTVHC